MKLSESQIFWIFVTTEVVMLIGLNIPSAILISKQDSWLSMLIGGGIGAALTFLFVHLSILHPNQTLTQFSQALLGKWLGRLIVLPHLIAWYTLTAYLLRRFPGFLQPIVIDRTPLWVLMILLLGLMVYLIYSTAITGIGRLCQIVGPIIILALIGSFIFNAGNADWHQLLPVFKDTGWLNIVKGSIRPGMWFSGPFTLLVIVAFMQNPQKALSKSMLGVGITVFMVFTATLMVLMVLGPNLAAKMRFPYIMYVRTIDILNFIQNLDIFIIFVWIFGVTAQLSLYLFVVSYETAQWFNVKNWRRIIWFGAPVIFIMAILIPNETSLATYDEFWTTVIFPVCGIAIPLILWIISLVKKNALNA
ncbi:GerAB/ArcD/ProY family transporter [Paenibacillus cremeus]|uniref:GerAB/ArcD/ProY family transporter n=1 Tax=Paenibacillus cremeus TaxID=2163881 RepID=A0A559K4V5_9BACL|nr:endospore germination permease [Paenibacillus cremeus]TVY07146.1 GerAB/ArcD/ProY family transporter [Paenibacillus cremeus]